MELWLNLLLEKGALLAVVASLCLLLEAMVDMHPRSATLLRGLPFALGAVGGYVFWEADFLGLAFLFYLSAALAITARFFTRSYWSFFQRLLVNALPTISFLTTAGVLRWGIDGA